MIHPHAGEKMFFPGVLLAILGLNIYSGIAGVKVSLHGAAVMLAVIFAAAYAVREFVPPRDWRRYVVWKRGSDA